MNRTRETSGRPRRRQPRVIGLFMGPGSLLPGIPAALDSGPPGPEPLERWTLGPTAPDRAGGDADAIGEPGLTTMPVRPVIRLGGSVDDDAPEGPRGGR
jgi:hypothetical protein